MISGQVDRLRTAAQTYRRLGNHSAESMLLDAADTIWQLRDDLQRANDAVRDAEHDESMAWDRVRKAEVENAKLREQIERLQPKDCEGNVLDIADTVSMLRSEYDGDHEWNDVVVELVLTKWGGDRWIVRGSKGEAWACDCAKTGYDEDAYEASDDVEPFGEPTLLEVENAKLRKLVRKVLQFERDGCEGCPYASTCDADHLYDPDCPMREDIERDMCELGVEVDE